MSRRTRGIRPGGLLPRLCALAALLLALPGCLTDGSIPVGGNGGTGVLRGVVAHAEDPDLPFSQARITVRSAAGYLAERIADPWGRFEIANVPDGLLEVTFEGAEPGRFLPVRILAHAQYASYSTIAVLLEPARLAQPDVTAVRVSPREVKTTVGQKVAFSADITGGNPRRQAPSWVLEGGIGSVTPRGEFRALHPGTGTLIAIAGGVSDAVTITVTAP